MGDDKRIPYRLIEQREATNRLVMILPGAGYSTQAPLLHFSTGLFYANGFDVLHINYSFSRQEMAELKEEDFARDVQHAFEARINKKKYSQYVIVAKSVGTIALSYLLDHPILKDVKLVWLTPLLQRDDVFHSMVNCDKEGLCVIGDQDPCYLEERYEKLKSNLKLTLKLVDGGNHSLELDQQPITSIDCVKDVMTSIQMFVLK
ncbi:alpha/beta hydrolase [Cytobacillus spongiae]|uniref:alpha/beta hydrolase n=1 Tax=Cytobacillus spongiae TaxID=2901381 RepID=UPI001F1BCC68|nr:alpha/beta hydrolase [Cytobacillus spongiae]UII55532.1 alpha/beta hydrolase [Cytobacillus spongiae]